MYHKIQPWLFRLDPESAHLATAYTAWLAQSVATRAIRSSYGFGHGSLGRNIFGLNFTNPVGLAAGFDKNARLIRFFEALGCGFVEVGSVTFRPSRGNPRPRAFRLPDDRALVNRMGLNNQGADRIARRLLRLRGKHRVPIGVNLANSSDLSINSAKAIEDFRQGFIRLGPLVDYVALNISCPNSVGGKTFEDSWLLDTLLRTIIAERERLGLTVPILVKVPPVLTAKVVYDSRLEEILNVSLQHRVAGIIAGNTASDRRNLSSSPEEIAAAGQGGLSGRPLLERTLRLVRYVSHATANRIPIIGVGGIDSPQSAFRVLRAGASLVQVYTGLVYEGPRLIQHIKEGLVKLMEKHGFSTISEVVGSDPD